MKSFKNQIIWLMCDVMKHTVNEDFDMDDAAFKAKGKPAMRTMEVCGYENKGFKSPYRLRDHLENFLAGDFKDKAHDTIAELNQLIEQNRDSAVVPEIRDLIDDTAHRLKEMKQFFMHNKKLIRSYAYLFPDVIDELALKDIQQEKRKTINNVFSIYEARRAAIRELSEASVYKYSVSSHIFSDVHERIDSRYSDATNLFYVFWSQYQANSAALDVELAALKRRLAYENKKTAIVVPLNPKPAVG